MEAETEVVFLTPRDCTNKEFTLDSPHKLWYLLNSHYFGGAKGMGRSSRNNPWVTVTVPSAEDLVDEDGNYKIEFLDMAKGIRIGRCMCGSTIEGWEIRQRNVMITDWAVTSSSKDG